MMADRRAAALANNFAGQWLEIRNLDVVKPDPEKFPEWGPELREAMKTETRMFFEYVLRENRPLSDFIDAKYTFLNARLAKFYGIPGVTGPDFRRVELTTDQRGGLLSQASVLTVSSYPDAHLRGAARQVCAEQYSRIGDPPAAARRARARRKRRGHVNVAAPADGKASRRSDVRFAATTKWIRSVSAWRITTRIGKWRTEDGKFPVDSSGTLPNGKSFKTPDEMRALLMAGLPQFSRCLTEKMLTYALGRGLASLRSPHGEWHQPGHGGVRLSFPIADFRNCAQPPFQMGRGDNAPGTRPATEAKVKEVAQR